MRTERHDVEKSLKNLESMGVDRRTALKVMAAAGLGWAAGSLMPTGGPRMARAAEDTIAVRMPTLIAGSTSMINTVISDKGFDKQNGLRIDYSKRSSIPAYYADFRVGRFDAIVGGVGNAMKERAAGADSTIFATQSPTAAFFLTRNPALTGIEGLRGKKIAAPVGSGNFLVARATAGLYGIDLQKDAELINVKGPGGGPTQLAAGRVDVAFSWEPAVSIFLSKNPDARIMVNVREAYRRKTGKDSHVIVLYAHEAFLKKHPEVVPRLIKTYQEAGNYFKTNLDAALEVVAKKTGKGTGPIKAAFLAGRVGYSTKPAHEERDMLTTLMQALVKIGFVKDIPPGIIYQS
ncbi:MAG: ABC transporter substrate-binding protein [Candidatus Methylomirabilia bacterium]